MIEQVFAGLCIPDVEGRFLSAFMEGECHLGVSPNNGGQTARCFVALNVRDDDRELLEWLLVATGVGLLRRSPAQGNSAPQLVWIVGRRSECAELVRFLRRFPFLGRKRHEFAIWATAVDLCLRTPEGWTQQVLELKRRIEAVRRYRPPVDENLELPSGDALRGYITGLAAAEGCFLLSANGARFSVHLRRDDAPLLEALASSSGLGSVSHHVPNGGANPSSTWSVGSQAHTQILARWLLDADLYGRKRAELEAWATAVEEIRLARVAGRKRNVAVMSAARAALATARAYEPQPDERPLEQLPRASLRERSIASIQRWASETEGRLSATDYELWRREVPEAPTRNSVARVMVSWHDALAAAGLEDRSSGSRAWVDAIRARSGSRAEQGRVAQRARVLAGLARYEDEYGVLPGVTEFMRWRLRTNADVPSHATYYRAFGGGWESVLADYRVARAAGPGRTGT